VHPVTGDILVEAEENAPTGKVTLDRLPAVKRRPDENQFLAATRWFAKFLHMDPNLVEVEPTGILIAEETKASVAYPGLNTLYRKRMISAKFERK